MFSLFIVYPAEVTTYLAAWHPEIRTLPRNTREHPKRGLQQHKAVWNHFLNFTHPYNVIPNTTTLSKAKSKAYDQKVERMPHLNVLLRNYFDRGNTLRNRKTTAKK